VTGEEAYLPRRLRPSRYSSGRPVVCALLHRERCTPICANFCSRPLSGV